MYAHTHTLGKKSWQRVKTPASFRDGSCHTHTWQEELAACQNTCLFQGWVLHGRTRIIIYNIIYIYIVSTYGAGFVVPKMKFLKEKGRLILIYPRIISFSGTSLCKDTGFETMCGNCN